jgi:hypothetical protein
MKDFISIIIYTLFLFPIVLCLVIWGFFHDLFGKYKYENFYEDDEEDSKKV